MEHFIKQSSIPCEYKFQIFFQVFSNLSKMHLWMSNRKDISPKSMVFNLCMKCFVIWEKMELRCF